MAHAVAEAMREQRHLLVQAGTGTGKSLGYLVPSLLHDERVVIATATLALQHQLMERDLPALIDAARHELGQEPRHAVVKGRGNYACLHRVRQGVPDDQESLVDVPSSALGQEVLQLREWAENQSQASDVGDRESAPAHTDLAWRQISVTARECLGATRCAFALECFAERAKERAQTADIVVTNHALLAIDAIEKVPMLPEHDVVVVDEAHELTARVTQAATAELDALGVARAARRARTLIDTDDAEDLNVAGDALAEVLALRQTGRIDSLDDELADALGAIRDAARAAVSALGKRTGDKDLDGSAQQAKVMADEIRQVAERMAALRETDVLWLADVRGAARLYVAPLDVAGALAANLFAERTVIITSATLTLGGDFVPLARSFGLPVAQEPWQGLDVGSPFDYARQGILYVAKHLPAPGRDGLTADHIDEICQLIEAAGGRTLGLFSSRRAAEAATEAVRQQLPELDVWCQGEAHLADLSQRFVDQEQSCLFGTLSLWQGVDLPGPTCQLVIIDRIPFPRPDDPLMSARQRLVERRGGNGFMNVAASHAALLLAQGVGRLIRRIDDRGVVAILDPRIVTARYGSFLTASLPPMWRTTDTHQVHQALRRLDANVRDGSTSVRDGEARR